MVISALLDSGWVGCSHHLFAFCSVSMDTFCLELPLGVTIVSPGMNHSSQCKVGKYVIVGKFRIFRMGVQPGGG